MHRIVHWGGGKTDKSIIKWRRALVALASAGGNDVATIARAGLDQPGAGQKDDPLHQRQRMHATDPQRAGGRLPNSARIRSTKLVLNQFFSPQIDRLVDACQHGSVCGQPENAGQEGSAPSLRFGAGVTTLVRQVAPRWRQQAWPGGERQRARPRSQCLSDSPVRSASRIGLPGCTSRARVSVDPRRAVCGVHR